MNTAPFQNLRNGANQEERAKEANSFALSA